MFSRLSEKISLVFHQDMKQTWGKEKNIECCNRNEKRHGLVEVEDLEFKRK
jgi:hypothetical protein